VKGFGTPAISRANISADHHQLSRDHFLVSGGCDMSYASIR